MHSFACEICAVEIWPLLSRITPNSKTLKVIVEEGHGHPQSSTLVRVPNCVDVACLPQNRWAAALADFIDFGVEAVWYSVENGCALCVEQHLTITWQDYCSLLFFEPCLTVFYIWKLGCEFFLCTIQQNNLFSGCCFYLDLVSKGRLSGTDIVLWYLILFIFIWGKIPPHHSIHVIAAKDGAISPAWLERGTGTRVSTKRVGWLHDCRRLQITWLYSKSYCTKV